MSSFRNKLLESTAEMTNEFLHTCISFKDHRRAILHYGKIEGSFQEGEDENKNTGILVKIWDEEKGHYTTPSLIDFNSETFKTVKPLFSCHRQHRSQLSFKSENKSFGGKSKRKRVRKSRRHRR